MEDGNSAARKPKLFVGSSDEKRSLALAIQANLEKDVDTVVWSQGLFALGQTSVENLERIANEYDFAALLVTPDDMVESRGRRRPIARDNIAFEAGFFMGRLGRARTFLVCQRDRQLELPSDLAGVVLAEFSTPANGNAQAVLGPACMRMRDEIVRLGRLSRFTTPPPPPPRDITVQRARPRRSPSLGTAVSLSPPQRLRVANISVSGALLATRGEIPVDEVLDLRIELENGALVTARAKVVRVQYPNWGVVGGVGVSFLDMPDDSMHALQAFVSENPLAS